MLPLGVVIPTKNSMPYLPRHLEAMRAWQDLAQEIIVVDSFSADGSADFIKARLAHPRVRFLSHPPGLYQSWNHGIAQIEQPYVYLATTGDTITRDGMMRLMTAAESLAADIVISKPEFVDRNGEPAENFRWPIDDIIAAFHITAPRKLAKLEPVIFSALNLNGALLGSAASNLYRAEIFRRLPFPVDFGNAGDGAWSLLHAAEVSWAVVPEKFSTFLVHPSNASADEQRCFQEVRRVDLMLSAMESWRRSGVVTNQDPAAAELEKMVQALRSYLDAKAAFDQNRHSSFPWIMNPRAWRNRMTRVRRARRFDELKRRVLTTIGLPQSCEK